MLPKLSPGDSPLGKVKQILPSGRPVFGGLPLPAHELARYEAVVAYLKAGKILKGSRPWWSPVGDLVYDFSEAQADLDKFEQPIMKGWAGRAAYLPADALPWADKYHTETVYDQANASFGNPRQSDEYGRSFKGKSVSVLDTVAALAPLVAPYIPGWGPALVAVVALAQGKELEDAVLAAVKSQLPGGALAGVAFDFGVALALGEPIDQAALQAALGSSPEARAAFAAAQVAMGRPADAAALDLLIQNYPELAPVIALAQDHGKTPAPFVMPTAMKKALLIKAQQTPALVFASVVLLDPVARAHRAVVPEADRSWVVAGATLGLVPIGILVARELARVAGKVAW